MTARAQRRDFMYMGSPGGRGGEGRKTRRDRLEPLTYTPALCPQEYPLPRPRLQDKPRDLGENSLSGRKMLDVYFLNKILFKKENKPRAGGSIG